MRDLLHGVVTSGTGTHSAVSEWSAGKTGTTENYGDAWFVGFTDRFTAAVWVGYPNGVKSMSTEYHGSPVEGGTYPAEIWHDLMQAIIDIDAARHPRSQASHQPVAGHDRACRRPPSTPTVAAPPPQQHRQTARAAAAGNKQPSAPAAQPGPPAPAGAAAGPAARSAPALPRGGKGGGLRPASRQ